MGVNVKGAFCEIIEPIKTLRFGNIVTQGLPFYGGNITYHLKVKTHCEQVNIIASSYKGHLLSLSVDNENKGNIVFSPYILEINNLKNGVHNFDLKYYGSRINTFGQLHNNDKQTKWWGPDSWRSTGDSWSYEYKFWEQGILKSPEIF